MYWDVVERKQLAVEVKAIGIFFFWGGGFRGTAAPKKFPLVWNYNIVNILTQLISAGEGLIQSVEMELDSGTECAWELHPSPLRISWSIPSCTAMPSPFQSLFLFTLLISISSYLCAAVSNSLEKSNSRRERERELFGNVPTVMLCMKHHHTLPFKKKKNNVSPSITWLYILAASWELSRLGTSLPACLPNSPPLGTAPPTKPKPLNWVFCITLLIYGYTVPYSTSPPQPQLGYLFPHNVNNPPPPPFPRPFVHSCCLETCLIQTDHWTDHWSPLFGFGVAEKVQSWIVKKLCGEKRFPPPAMALYLRKSFFFPIFGSLASVDLTSPRDLLPNCRFELPSINAYLWTHKLGEWGGRVFSCPDLPLYFT